LEKQRQNSAVFLPPKTSKAPCKVEKKLEKTCNETLKSAGKQRQLTLFDHFQPKNSERNRSSPVKLSASASSSRAPLKFNQERTVYAPHTSWHKLNTENLETWIYPVNYSKRTYQFEIIRTALLHNTLVCLPTGLGKTFIAAVVMFNYYRWFSSAKIVFMAPTKPLVSQQMEACFKITGLCQLDTVELNGSMSPNIRQAAWKDKRVFFLTPQILQNDLQSRICQAEDFVLLVFDEAHRATGN
jgi:superfamily II DNA or RNA helicase